MLRPTVRVCGGVWRSVDPSPPSGGRARADPAAEERRRGRRADECRARGRDRARRVRKYGHGDLQGNRVGSPGSMTSGSVAVVTLATAAPTLSRGGLRRQSRSAERSPSTRARSSRSLLSAACQPRAEMRRPQLQDFPGNPIRPSLRTLRECQGRLARPGQPTSSSGLARRWLPSRTTTSPHQRTATKASGPRAVDSCSPTNQPLNHQMMWSTTQGRLLRRRRRLLAAPFRPAGLRSSTT
jgi:hypothetical protein